MEKSTSDNGEAWTEWKVFIVWSTRYYNYYYYNLWLIFLQLFQVDRVTQKLTFGNCWRRLFTGWITFMSTTQDC